MRLICTMVLAIGMCVVWARGDVTGSVKSHAGKHQYAAISCTPAVSEASCKAPDEHGLGADSVTLLVSKKSDITNQAVTRVPVGTSLRIYAIANNVQGQHRINTALIVKNGETTIGTGVDEVIVGDYGSGLDEGEYTIKVDFVVYDAVTDTTWVDQTATQNVTFFKPTIVVDDIKTAVGGNRITLVRVYDGEEVLGGINLDFLHTDVKYIASFEGTAVSDVHGMAMIGVTGVAVTTPTAILSVKAISGNVPNNQAAITVVEPTITIDPNLTIGIGGWRSVAIEVKADDGIVSGLGLQIDTLDTNHATGTFENNGISENGVVWLRVTGASLTNGTPLKVRPVNKQAPISNQCNVVVLPTTIEIENSPTVHKGQDTVVRVWARAGTIHLNGVKLAVTTLNNTFATATWPSGDETIGGFRELKIHGVDTTVSPGTILTVDAPNGGAGAQDSELVNVIP